VAYFRPINTSLKKLCLSVAYLALTLTIVAFNYVPAGAAEDGKQFYLLGSRASLAGTLPPPGTYVSSFKYYYSGDASGAAADGVALDQLGNITLQADIDLDVMFMLEVPTLLWVAPGKVLGGSLGLGLLVPVGYQELDVGVDVLATLTLPNGTTFTKGAMFSLDDDTLNFGDPVLQAVLGWNSGNWHWNVNGLLNVPIGAYDKKNLVNMGFNRWAFDASGAATWLNAQTGREASVVAGFTFNGTNDDTNYNTGTEFHVEAALMQHLSKAFAIGIVGLHYEQVTNDSGAGATLGGFKGRTTAIGPNINYNFKFGQTPVSTQLRWYHELDVKNRMKGDTVFFQATIPIGGPRQ